MTRANGTLPGIWPCAIDVGYSSVKVFAPNQVAVFPSFARPFNQTIIGTLPPSHILYRDADTGETWIVGEGAQEEISQDDTTISEESVFGRARYDDPMFQVLVRTGIGIGLQDAGAASPEGRVIHIQTGLPPKYLKTDSGPLRSAMAGRHRFFLRIGNQPEQSFDFTIDAAHVAIMEQPMGTLMSVAIDNQHKFVRGADRYFNGSVLVFDAGFGTLDLFPIRHNHVGDKQTFPEYGMIQVFRQTIEQIYESYGVEVSLVGFQQCLANGMVSRHDKFSSEKVPFADLLAKADHDVCDAALEKLGQIFPLYDYDTLILTGGTGAAWNEQVRKKLQGLSSLQIVDGNVNDPALPFLLSNARGYYMYLFNSLERKIRAARGGSERR